MALDSSFAVHFNNLGNSYIQTRRYIEAESVIKKAIALDSTVAAPWVNLGNLYILTRRYTEAEPVIKKP
ncbi:MAG: tetratricopeptide repeat protein [Saprospiraceae bacterium]|nr:tetratricopeptide repeat protein [Candidatus Defluviibacterium haderslevense]